MSFKEPMGEPLLQDRPTKPRPSIAVSKIIFDAFPPELVIGLGAAVQIISSYFLPYPFALAPVALLFVLPITKRLLTIFRLVSNPYMKNVVPGISVPRLPGTEVDEDGTMRSPEFSVALVGARCNGPLGLFDPTFGPIGNAFGKMEEDLRANPNSGLLAAEPYMSINRASQNSFMTVFYFKSTQDVMRFAHEHIHKSAWGDLRRRGQEATKHIELWHEVLTVKQSGFEAVYINSEPRNSGVVSEGTPGGQWKSVLRSPLGRGKTAKGRLGGKIPGSQEV